MKETIISDKVKRARTIFLDQEEYADEQLIGYLRIVEKLFHNCSKLKEKSLIAKGIEFVLSRMSAEKQLIMKMRFMEGCTLYKIGEVTMRSRESVRKIEKSCLEYLIRNINEFSVEGYLKLEEAKANMINQIKLGKVPQSELSIKVLNLSTRAYNSLTRKGIKTLDQLFKLSKYDLLRIYNVGETTVEEIYKEIKSFLPEKTDSIPLTNDIESLGLPPKCCQFLKARGIITVEQLYNCSKKDLSKIAGITASKIHKIRLRLREWFPNWDPHDKIDTQLNNVDIYYLELSTRPYNALQRSGVTRIGQLMNLTDIELKKIPGLGNKAIDEINLKVNKFVLEKH